ncbi:hypothetical protein FGO68_gene7746 [Halteria grandinella]|uniref:Uncharacterized protein n=1 Tax=Halteria grandinella TaxID=5974 RepID=A0A8J8P1T2_HALGN|nr:hypothetical protein FGO68_gene7746 [Halteria grandinella]
MYYLSRKSCFLHLLSYLDFQQVQILLYRSSNWFRQRLIQKQWQLKHFCEDAIINHNYTTLQLYFNSEDFSENLLIEDNELEALKAIDFQEEVNLKISIQKPPSNHYSVVSQKQAKELRVGKVEIQSEFNNFEQHKQELTERIWTHFRPRREYLDVLLKMSQMNINQQISFNQNVKRFEIKNSDKIYISVECLYMIQTLHIQVDKGHNKIEFENLLMEYPNTNFIITFSHNLPNFLVQYQNLFYSNYFRHINFEERSPYHDQVNYAFKKHAAKLITQISLQNHVTYSLQSSEPCPITNEQDSDHIMYYLIDVKILRFSTVRVDFNEFLSILALNKPFQLDTLYV